MSTDNVPNVIAPEWFTVMPETLALCRSTASPRFAWLLLLQDDGTSGSCGLRFVTTEGVSRMYGNPCVCCTLWRPYSEKMAELGRSLWSDRHVDDHRHGEPFNPQWPVRRRARRVDQPR